MSIVKGKDEISRQTLNIVCKSANEISGVIG